ncbi:copper amine oxidase-like domain-containing protein [Desulfotomaculum nigrificans CO-1-SRB]|uniref:Copper amine oxidase-like domain-containing protein n=1 Tax=Desulfotomaculum nigrificans (strain DSM 14880 / VKM B-2319 / CO-1-SRB) TaxID=868595 RepID=F6B3G8_DESCC|nr:stalk domain-containing protein [Desulfotomaculum nigrificans]AEF93997.1 copper amine oxidase-like domain-containing protein [Desulfotomaculum nigrificans CO-1-SRB]
MRKRGLVLLTVLIIALTIVTPAGATQIFIDGHQLKAPTAVENGTTLVPLRPIFQSLGANVTWDDGTKTVTATKGDLVLTLRIGYKTAYLNHQPIALQVPAKVIEGSTMVPLRFVSEALGADVNWDGTSKTITITSNSPPPQTNTVPNNQIFNDNSDPLYIAIRDGLRQAQAKVVFQSVNQGQYQMKQIQDIAQRVLIDHPDLNYVDSLEIRASYGREVEIEITFNYYFSRTKVKQMISAVDKKSLEIINTVIKPGMSDLEKEKALHDYIVLNTKYDYENYLRNTVPKESYTTYGVLINGVGVCQGYASAMWKLLTMAGLECKYITGTGIGSNGPEPHGWNRVKIDGRWYNLDTTWDDPVPDRPGQIRYKYFNLTDNEMMRDHTWDASQL